MTDASGSYRSQDSLDHSPTSGICRHLQTGGPVIPGPLANP